MARIQDSGAAEEIVQEAFIRAWKSPKTPHTQREFQRWLYAIILNLVRDHERRRLRWIRLPFLLQPAENPAREAEQHLGDAALNDAVRHLTRRERDAIYLRFFQDASYGDAAATMRVKESTVRVLVNRALHKLRRQLSAGQENTRKVSV